MDLRGMRVTQNAYRIGSIKALGFYFSNGMTTDYHIKNSKKNVFSMISEGMGLYSRVGL